MNRQRTLNAGAIWHLRGTKAALKLWRVIAISPVRTLVIGVCAAALSVPLLGGLTFDLSFRPLLSEDKDLAHDTAAMTKTFGTLGTGAVGVFIQAEDVLSENLLRATASASKTLRTHQDVVGVLSPTALPVPGIGQDALTLLPSCEARMNEASSRHQPQGDCRRQMLELEQRAPRPFGLLVSEDHKRLVFWVDVETSVFALKARKETLASIEATVEQAFAPTGARVDLVGYSVVEKEYEALLIRGAAMAALVTLLVIGLVAFFLFRKWPFVVAALCGVSVGIPVTLASIAVIGWPITLVSAALPTLLLMVGVADSIHLLRAVQHQAERGGQRQPAHHIKRAWLGLLQPCALTTVTTAIGFGSLMTAGLSISREFGAAAALGVVVVHICNAVLAPAVLLAFSSSVSASARPPRNSASFARVGRWIDSGAVPLSILGGGALLGFALLSADIELAQYFNRDVAEGHRLRRAQTALEESFPGFLGPNVVVARVDGLPLNSEEDFVQIRTLSQALEKEPLVTRVFAATDVVDYFPASGTTPVAGQKTAGQKTALPPMLWPMLLDGSATAPSDVLEAAQALRSPDAKEMLLLVRTRDVGTQKAMELLRRVDAVTASALPKEYTVTVAGVWVQAQSGMSLLVKDLFRSFCFAFLLILPFLWWGCRTRSLFTLAVLPNLAPLVVVLGAMVLLGIPLRIGTAIVCAVALGIAVDDTFHLVHAIEREERARPNATTAEILTGVYNSAGAAVLTTTVILSVGFLSLTVARLQVLTDMGILGAVVMVAALAFDGVWLLALWSWVRRRSGDMESTPPAEVG